MKNMTTHTGKLEIIQRLPSSANGNPRYLLRVDGWTCRTSPNSSLGYSVTNYDGKIVKATIGTHYGVATLDSVSGVIEAEAEAEDACSEDPDGQHFIGCGCE